MKCLRWDVYTSGASENHMMLYVSPLVTPFKGQSAQKVLDQAVAVRAAKVGRNLDIFILSERQVYELVYLME